MRPISNCPPLLDQRTLQLSLISDPSIDRSLPSCIVMTPVYLNPPSSPFSSFVDQQTHEDQRLKLFISSSSPYNQASASCSLSSPTFFDSLEPQIGTATTSLVHQSQLYNHKAHNPTWHGGTSYDDQVCSSSSSLVDQPAAVVLDVSKNKDHKFLSTSTTERVEVNLGDEESSKSKNNNNRTVKWMSSKIRLMQKMANPTSDHNINAHKFPTTTAQQQQQPLENSDTSSLISNSSSYNTTTAAAAVTVRVCSDCNTNTTPLWRSGPRGPKSLCNACGIRQRKARRAMVEAAAGAAANGFVDGSGTAIDTSTSFMKVKVPNKEKKSRGGTGSHVAQRHKINNKSKLSITDDTGTSCSTTSHSTHHHSKRNKLCFKTSFQRVFPQDVAEAAVLLMELSCGLINHSS